MKARPKSRIAEMAKHIAAKHGLDIDNPAVLDIARLEVAMQLEERALEEGRSHNTANLLNLRTALRDAHQTAGTLQPRKVELVIVEGVQGVFTCEQCQHVNHVDAQTGERKEEIVSRGKTISSPIDATPRQATETNADAIKSAPATPDTPDVSKQPAREPDRNRGEYVNSRTGAIEVLPLKRLEPPNVIAWRNPDPADAKPVPVAEHGLQFFDFGGRG